MAAAFKSMVPLPEKDEEDDVKPMLFCCLEVMSRAARSPMLKVFLPAPVIALYVICAVSSWCIFWVVAGGERSFLLTMAAIVHCFGIALLCFQVFSRRNAQGISVGTLFLEAVSVTLRLSSTCHIEGYLPFDKSGDYLYQCVDALCLILVAILYYRVRILRRGTNHVEKDSFNIFWVLLVALALAIPLHADVDDSPVFDTLWMAGLFTSIAAQIPQLWLITKMKGHVEALTSHYIIATAVGVLCSGSYMYQARDAITCQEWIEGFNHAVYSILLAHVVHLLFLGDFAYCYVRALMQKGPRELDVFLWV